MDVCSLEVGSMCDLCDIHFGTSGNCARSTKNHGEQSGTARYKGMEAPGLF